MLNKVLIIALDKHWTGISRLPFGLNRAGFTVFALCPRKSYLSQTKYLSKSILYPTFTYSRSKLIYFWMLFAFLYFRPQLVIPGDEDAILALQNLANILDKIPFLGKFSKLIRRSIPSKKYDSIILSKSDFQTKCLEWGIRVPKSLDVHNLNEALSAAEELGFPLVLKLDAGYGGSGVFICQNALELKDNFRQLQTRTVYSQIKGAFRNLFFVTIFNTNQKISLQQYIEGRVGLAPFCATNGLVYGSNPMLKLRTYPGATGPTSVAQGIDLPEIENFIKIVAKNLNYNGFGSLDFIIDDKSGLPFVIEINPRPVPTCHFTSDLVANDLCEHYFRALNFLPTNLKPFHPYTIAIFPNEKKRDPQSPFLVNAFHDVPLNDPQLLKALDPK